MRREATVKGDRLVKKKGPCEEKASGKVRKELAKEKVYRM